MLRIQQLKLEVCSPCQLDCKLCAHGVMRKSSPHYQLSLEQLDSFLFYTETSGYFIEEIKLNGPGEPLLWRHLNEGLKRLNSSPAIGKVFIVTNGEYLNRIETASWGYVDEMKISIYEGFKQSRLVAKLQALYGDKIQAVKYDSFLDGPAEQAKGLPIPCRCACPGPMLYGDKVYLYCGPPVFEAARRMGLDASSLQELYVYVGPNYLARLNPSKTGRLDFCKFCWANENRKPNLVAHESRGGGWMRRELK